MKKAGNRYRLIVGAAIASLLSILLAACPGAKAAGEKQSGRGGGSDPVPVLAAVAERADLPVYIDAIGTVEAYSSVSVKSLVGGQLMKVHFEEGQDIKRGDLLFSIDDRQYKAALHQAEANLAKNQVQAKNAEANRLRYSNMMQQNAAAKSEYDEARTQAEALNAQVLADQAAVETAQLLLEHCSIESPIDGRAGDLKVNEGNIVKANDMELVTLNQIEPIYVSFVVPETRMPEIRKFYQEAKKLQVLALIPGEEHNPETGELSFVDNRVDSATGTIRLKATFENTNHRLWPGQFVNVQLELTTNAGALIIPAEAVQTGQNQQYVYLVKSDQAVEHRPVTTGMVARDKVVVTSGLQEGDTVVTDGHLRLIPGAKVALKKDLQPAIEPAPMGKAKNQLKKAAR